MDSPAFDSSDASIDLAYTPPIAWDRLLAFLSARAAPSVECANADGYARTVRVGGRAGLVRVTSTVQAGSANRTLRLSVTPSLIPIVDAIVVRMREVLDLNVDPNAVEAHLAATALAPIERLRHGLRVPGAFDAFELSIRAILGQQVSVKGASTLMARFTTAFGERFATDHPALTHLAATAERVADATVLEIREIGIPVARATTIQRLAREIADQRIVIEPGVDVPNVMRQLTALPGIGPWTAEYIAMRAMHWTDAFPASDLVLRRNAGVATPAQLVGWAERWRPWRAYAAMQIWSGIQTEP